MFTDLDFAEDYDRRLAEEGYPGNIFHIIEEELRGYKTVIDIGAGTGFFSIPLTKSGYTVSAVEPSEAMAGILQRKAENENLHIDISVCSWEDWPGTKKDAVISIHSVYGFSDLGKAVEKMTSMAKKRIILVKTDESSTFTKAVRNALGEPEKGRNFPVIITDVLKKSCMKFRLDEIIQQRDYLLKNTHTEAEWFKKHYRFNSVSLCEIHNAIEAVSQIHDGHRIYRSRYHDQLIIW